jgi:hypothetical protein
MDNVADYDSQYGGSSSSSSLRPSTLSTPVDQNNKRPRLNIYQPPSFDSVCKRLLKLNELKVSGLIQAPAFDVLLNQFNESLLNAPQPDQFEDIADQMLQLKLIQELHLLRPGAYEKLQMELHGHLLPVQGGFRPTNAPGPQGGLKTIVEVAGGNGSYGI